MKTRLKKKRSISRKTNHLSYQPSVKRPSWQLQAAKAHFSEVVREALMHGPQKVTRNGQEMVVVLSIRDYEKLFKPRVGLVELIRTSPLMEVDINLERSKDLPRDITF